MKNFNALITLILTVPVFLFVSCKDHGGDNININAGFSVTPAGNSLLSKEKQTLTLSISSAAAWNLSSSQTWVTASTYSGAAGRTAEIIFDIGANSAAYSRTAVLTVKDAGTGTTLKIIYVSQLGTSGNPVVKWIYDELKTEYYWNKSVQDAPAPNPDLEYDDFLENLIIKLKGAYDTEPSGNKTIDGGYRTNGERYIYSYILKNPAATRAIDTDGMEQTFGFGFYPYYVTGTNLINAMVTWVRPGSPADGVLKRGMVIERYQGNTINYNAYVYLFNQVYYMEGSESMTLGIVGKASPVTLTSAQAEMTPILYKGIIESPVLKKKVAYLVYNEFETGPRVSGNIYRFDNYLRESFAGFAGADELVLDLRYNLGGAVSSCQVLTSLIGNTAIPNSTTFAYLTFNEDFQDNEEQWYFRNEPNKLATIDKVYVLATGDSASASEMVINALRGIDFPVILIGEQTEGKNVGMNLFEKTIDGYDYEMWPITFKISNAKHFSDYANGFEPDYKVSDLVGTIYEFGNPQEALLKRALALIDGNQRAEFTDTRAGDKPAGIPYPRPLPGGGARIPHSPGAGE